MAQDKLIETENLVKTLMSDLEHFKVSAQTLVSISQSKNLEITELEKQLDFHRKDIVRLTKELQHYREIYGELNG